MIKTKTPAEIEIMREGGRRLVGILKKLKAALKPGIFGTQVNDLAIQLARAQGGEPSFWGYKGYPAAICLSINHGVVHGIPKPKPLEKGDLVKLDMGFCFKGFHTDATFSMIVGEKGFSPLMRNCYEALLAGSKQVKAGALVDDVSRAIEEKIKKAGYTILRAFTGHGIGRELHENPLITNFVSGNRLQFPPSSAIALEPIVGEGKEETITLSDNWTVVTKDKSRVAHFEHTILVKDDGFEVLTPLDKLI